MAMTSENGPGTVMDQRAAAVAATIAAIRGIEAELGVTPAALDRIRETLIALATRTELFPDASFPIPAGAVGRAYRLAEDPDHRFALYASAGSPGREGDLTDHSSPFSSASTASVKVPPMSAPMCQGASGAPPSGFAEAPLFVM